MGLKYILLLIVKRAGNFGWQTVLKRLNLLTVNSTSRNLMNQSILRQNVMSLNLTASWYQQILILHWLLPN